jgi:hypothetical protein
MYVHDCQKGRHACKCSHRVSQIVVGAWAIIFIIRHNYFSTCILNPPDKAHKEAAKNQLGTVRQGTAVSYQLCLHHKAP